MSNKGDEFESPDEAAWSAWNPYELAARLKDLSLPWCVVGGWALDLWHGHQLRDHEDIEFTILRDDFAAFRACLADMRFYSVQDGQIEYLAPDEQPEPDVFQIWCEEIASRTWRADMMIEPGTLDRWVYKREPSISAPRKEMVARTADGIPYLKPAAVLLFKAKYLRPKDEADFEHALPKLTQEDRAWLRSLLEILHPGHVWISSLS
ncbi:amino acid transporter [Rhizobium wenxiniae]|uniref:nucleotidyltransferase domain-containing protein n=1 Tax=Rhizobium wenxiniae TaxID=1737357 RepID=UPI001C6E834A|nr:amino acid transporter [Rhizobium wenxiniae]